MSYAAMREIVNNRFGERYVVPVKDIVNFSREKYNARIKYSFKMGEDTLCGIIHEFDDDPDKLKKAIKEKRLSTPTLTKCKTNLACPETSNAANAKRSGNTAEKLDAPKKKLKILTDQILNDQDQFDLSKVKQEFAAKKSKKMGNTSRLSSQKKENKTSISNTRSTSSSRTSSAISSAVVGSLITHTQGSSDEMNYGNGGTPPKMENQSSPVSVGLDLLRIDKDLVASRSSLHERNQKTAQNVHLSENNKSSPQRSPILSGSMTSTPSNTVNKLSSKLDSDARLHEMERTIQEKEAIISKQQKTIEDLKRALEDKQDLLEDMTRTTIDVQKKAVNNFDELYKLVSDLKQANKNTASPDGAYKSIGYVNHKNFTVHVGRDFYIPNNKWNYACSMVCPKDFVHELARAVIGEAEMKKSTLTGQGSRRSGKGNVPTWDQVDPLKVEAIRDALGFFLGARKFSKMSAAEKSEHVLSVQVYIRSLISDLKRDKSGPRNQNTSTKAKKSTTKGNKLAHESNERDCKTGENSGPDSHVNEQEPSVDDEGKEKKEREQERIELNQKVTRQRSEVAVNQDDERIIDESREKLYGEEETEVNETVKISRKITSSDEEDKENHEKPREQNKEDSSDDDSSDAYDNEDDRHSMSSEDQTLLLSRSVNFQDKEELGTPAPSDLEDNDEA